MPSLEHRMYSNRLDSHSTKDSNAAQLPALVPLEVVLARHNLDQYTEVFEQAGFKLYDIAKHMSDMEVEAMLAKVERSRRSAIPVHDRIALWKALRHAWHLGPGHHVPFINRAEVPRIFLPKLDFRMMDSETKWADIDPDRARQILRKRVEKAGPKGIAVQTIQFEVYQRQLDMVYELRDLRTCLNEWQKQNPRRLYKEDSREEVLKARVKHLSDFVGIVLQERRSVMSKSLQLAVVLVVMRVIAVFMIMLMLFTAYYRYRNSPNPLMLSFIIASGQFRSALAFLLVFWFSYAIALRRKDDPLVLRLRAVLISCERLQEQIADFRERTNDLRIAETNNKSSKTTQVQHRKLHRRKEKRKEQDDSSVAALQLSSDIANADGVINVKFLMKSLEDSYKKLPPLPEGFERPSAGGDRMNRFEHQVGGNVDVSNKRAAPRTTDVLALPIGKAAAPVFRPRSESPTSSGSLSPKQRTSRGIASNQTNFLQASQSTNLLGQPMMTRDVSASNVLTSSQNTTLTR